MYIQKPVEKLVGKTKQVNLHDHDSCNVIYGIDNGERTEAGKEERGERETKTVQY